MPHLAFRVRCFALLSFLMWGCNGPEEELLEPAASEQVRPGSEVTAVSQALTVETQAPVAGSAPAPQSEAAKAPEAHTQSFNSGYQYSHLTWRPVGPRTAEFSVLGTFSRTYAGSGPDGLAVTGDFFREFDTRLCFGDEFDPNYDCLENPRFEVIDYSVEQNWVLGRVVPEAGPQPLPGTGVTVTETEPNSTMDTANQMELGDDFFSNYSFREDWDYVRFTLTQQTQISLRSELGTLSSGFLTLYSSSGESLAYSTSYPPWEPSAHIEITLEAGTYFLQVGSSASYYDQTGTQLVQLRQLGDVPPAPITHTYAGDGPYTASLDGCCRPGGYYGRYTLNTQVRFDLPNSSPVSSLQPVAINVPANLPGFSLQIPATDADGDELTFRLATRSESGIEYLPPGLAVSSEGVLTWNTTGLQRGQQWYAQVVMEERRDDQLMGSSAVDFLMRVTAAADHAPTCDIPPGTTYDIGAGELMGRHISASDLDEGDVLTLSASSLPSGASFEGPWQDDVLGSVIGYISWTPSASLVGSTITANFTATDMVGHTIECPVNFRVLALPPYQPPVANAGPDLTAFEGAPVMLDARGSSGRGLSYEWTSDQVPSFLISSVTSPTPTFTPSEPGDYRFSLHVTDSRGATSYAQVTVHVQNVAPVVSVQGGTVAPGVPFMAVASITEPGTDFLTNSIDYGDGSGEQWGSRGNALRLEHTYTEPGIYTVTISVQDEQGAVGTTTVQVEVTYEVPVVVNARGGDIEEGSTFTAPGSFLARAGSGWTATVNYGDGSGYEPLALDGQSFMLSHTYADDGGYAVSIRVTSAEGITAEASVLVWVFNAAPVVSATAEQLSDGTISISGSFTDPGADRWKALINYGDDTWEWVPLNGDKTFTSHHRYARSGNLLAGVVVFEIGDDGYESELGWIELPVSVPPQLRITTVGTALEGQEWLGSGTFITPAGWSWNMYVDYGDGQWGDYSHDYNGHFFLSHAYAEDGVYTVTVTLVMDDGTTATTTTEVVVHNTAPQVHADPWPWNPTEGWESNGYGWIMDGPQDFLTGTVDFGDGSGLQPLYIGGYSYDWGFGFSTPSHVYANSGIYTVTYTVTDDDGATGTFSYQVKVANMTPWVYAYGNNGQEGSVVTSSGGFGDLGTESWTVMADYGDGTGLQPVTSSEGPYGDHVFELSHVYANEGYYMVTIYVTDSDGGVGITTTWTWIENVDPQVIVPEGAPLDEGSTFTSTGSFIDPGADTWTAEVDYGDGSGWQPLELDGQTFQLSHFYATAGYYSVNIRIMDGGDYGGWSWFPVEVQNVLPVVTAVGDTIPRGSVFTSSGSFTDPGTYDWWVWVDYGDGSEGVGMPSNGKTFELSHLYEHSGTYNVTIQVWDSWDRGEAIVQVVVVDPPPGVSLQGAESHEGDWLSLQGSFSRPAVNWAVTVDYGDGSGEQPLLADGTTFTLGHVYMDNGTYTVTVRAVDENGGMGVATAQVVVHNVAPTVTADGGAASEGALFTSSGAFTDPGQDTWTATVDYGDGSGPQPLELDGTTFTLSHVYADNGLYTVLVRVQDEDGGVGTASVQVTVENSAPVVTASSDGPVYWGLPVHFTGMAVDSGSADTAAGFVVRWEFGDGTTDSSASTSHSYAAPGSYAAVLTATDKDGASASASTAVVVQKRPSSLTCDDSLAIYGYPVSLSAQLADALPGALLGGKAIAFRVGSATPFGSGTTGSDGSTLLPSPGSLAPGHYTITVSFAGDSHYTGAQAECSLTITGSDGHIQGGGLRLANGSRGGFSVKVDDAGVLDGELRFTSASTSFHAHTVTALGISTDRLSGWFAGTGEDGRQFQAYVEDHGDHGTGDVFKLWLNGVLVTGNGQLTGGNIRIHGEPVALAP